MNENKLLALTFDDGPAETTIAIIRALQRNEASATFFVNGCCLKKYPEITKMAAGNGCEIANHTTNHLHLPELTYEEVVKEIETTNDLIEEITGSKPSIMRPPFGEYDGMVRQAAKDCNLALVNWSIDPYDWESDEATTTRQRILEELKENSVILCHDRMVSTSELMITFIAELYDKGYMLVTVTELFRRRKIKMMPGVMYLSPDQQS